MRSPDSAGGMPGAVDPVLPGLTYVLCDAGGGARGGLLGPPARSGADGRYVLPVLWLWVTHGRRPGGAGT